MTSAIGKPNGRPRIQIDPVKLAEYIAQGHPAKWVAAEFGVSWDTARRRIKLYKALQGAESPQAVI